MFREMRRRGQMMSREEIEAILKNCSTAVLAVTGDDDYPYAVPMNYVYQDGKLYFHCAKTGHKVDSIKKGDKVSVCVIEQDRVVAEAFATNYRSAIVFGRARLLEEEGEKRAALEHLNEKYSKDYPEQGKKEIEDSIRAVCIIEVTVEHMSGKAAIKDIQEMDKK